MNSCGSGGCHHVSPSHRREPFLEGRACRLGAGLLRDLEHRCRQHRQREASAATIYDRRIIRNAPRAPLNTITWRALRSCDTPPKRCLPVNCVSGSMLGVQRWPSRSPDARRSLPDTLLVLIFDADRPRHPAAGIDDLRMEGNVEGARAGNRPRPSGVRPTSCRAANPRRVSPVRLRRGPCSDRQSRGA